MRSIARVVTMPKAKVVKQSPKSTFLEIVILSVAAASVENLDERIRGGIRSVSMFAGIVTGIPSSVLAETGASGGVTLRLILNLRFPTDKNPPSGDCNTKRLLFGNGPYAENGQDAVSIEWIFREEGVGGLAGPYRTGSPPAGSHRPNVGGRRIFREIALPAAVQVGSDTSRKRAISSQAAREAARWWRCHSS